MSKELTNKEVLFLDTVFDFVESNPRYIQKWHLDRQGENISFDKIEDTIEQIKEKLEI